VEAVENMDADEVMSPEFFTRLYYNTAWAATTAKRTYPGSDSLLDSMNRRWSEFLKVV
jgi:hypothetical protein